ncbi:Pectin lyase-like superfamily protein [Euphorbia peplus]|nr:Pectin lyase-like superfamily protein [Euphorbia peplus]
MELMIVPLSMFRAITSLPAILFLRIGGDMAAFYSCKFYGYQDTLLDEKGRHFFKSCYIEGTIDFIFGSGKSLYLLSEIHTLKQEWTTVITAQGKQEKNEDSGFSFVHCIVTGDTPGVTYLGRAWQKMAEVIFSYCSITNAIHPTAWDAFNKPQLFTFGEFQNTGVGADLKGRAPFTKNLDVVGAKKYLNLGYIQASKWLVPPTGA